MRLIPLKKTASGNAAYTGLAGELVVIIGGGLAIHDGVTPGGLLVEPVHLPGGRNLIRNANFTILQNGTSWLGISGDTYIADGYYHQSGGGSTANVAVSNSHRDGEGDVNNSLRVTTATGGLESSFSIVSQRIAGVALLAGRPLTLSFKAKASTATSIALEFGQDYKDGGTNDTKTLVGRADLSTSWKRFELTFSAPDLPDPYTVGADNHSFLYFWLEAGNDFNDRTGGLDTVSTSFDIANIQMEVGASATPFEIRTREEEFRKVAEYFEKYASNSIILSKEGRQGATDKAGGFIPFSVKKRAVPAMSDTVYQFLGSPLELFVNDYGFSIQGDANSTSSPARLNQYTANAEIAPA